MYKKTIDIWALSTSQIAALTPGQWVKAGQYGDKGRFHGVKKSGSVVVAWYHNAKNSGDYNKYNKTLYTYAQVT